LLTVWQWLKTFARKIDKLAAQIFGPLEDGQELKSKHGAVTNQ
jgi:hypothetical protein